MSKYKFTTDEFGISEKGIHLLRSNYNYETIEFKDIVFLEIDKGKLIRNWILVLAIGIGLLAFSVYYVFGLIEVFNDPTIHSIYIEEIVVPVLPFLFGGFCIYASFRTGIVLKVNANGKRTTYPLTVITKNNELPQLIAYLKSISSVNSKLKVNI